MSPYAPVAHRIEELGIRISTGRVHTSTSRVGELDATLARGRSHQAYHVAHGDRVALSDITRVTGKSDAPLLVWSIVIPPRTAEAYRRMGVQYADAAGNAWLEFGDVLIDIRGRRPVEEMHPRPLDKRSTNLFSAGRSKVIFALLTWPHLWEASKRELAHVAGVSVGLAHDSITLLEQSGYGKYSRMSRNHGLLDPWAAAYATARAPPITLGSYPGDFGAVVTTRESGEVLVSGESAAKDLIRPTTLTLYVEQPDPRLPVANRWRADGEPTIFVRRRFWHAPDERQDHPPGLGLRDAPWTIVYADLVSNDDPRLQNVAREWRDRHADPS